MALCIQLLGEILLSFILQDSVDTILNLTGIKNTVHVMPTSNAQVRILGFSCRLNGSGNGRQQSAA